MSVDATTAVAGTGLSPAQREVAGAIKQASRATGASFEYLVTTAKIESDLKPRAAASTSSARGLYQFIDQTWLGTVKEAGAALGYGRYADAITKQRSGAYTVSDPTMRSEILRLRDDPSASAAMAGVLTNSNSFKLVGAVGRRVSDNELYMAHFLGVGGATRLLKAAATSPQASAADLFPRAAAANRSIFYDKSGNARSVAAVYGEITRRYNVAANSNAARSTIAAADGIPDASATVAVASAAAPYLAALPTAVQPSGASAAVSAVPAIADATGPQLRVAASSDQAPMFRTLFQAGNRDEPISPAVRALWSGNTGGVTQSGSLSAADIKLKAPRPLDLFSDPNGSFS